MPSTRPPGARHGVLVSVAHLVVVAKGARDDRERNVVVTRHGVGYIADRENEVRWDGALGAALHAGKGRRDNQEPGKDTQEHEGRLEVDLELVQEEKEERGVTRA